VPHNPVLERIDHRLKPRFQLVFGLRAEHLTGHLAIKLIGSKRKIL